MTKKVPKATITIKGPDLARASRISRMVSKPDEKPVGVTEVVRKSLYGMEALLNAKSKQRSTN